MQNDTSNTSNEKDYSNHVKIKKENIICKDGFCSISDHDNSSRIDKDNINLFDPI